MGKLTLDKLNAVEHSSRLLESIDALKGGSEEHCHNGHGKGSCNGGQGTGNCSGFM